MTIRKRRTRIKLITEEREKGDAEAALLQEIRALRHRVIEASVSVATEGVREFANGLLISQGRLGVHAVLLRSYTARLLTGLRHWLNGSEVMKAEPLLPWQQDSVAQKAIQVCEDVLAARRSAEGCGRPAEEEVELGAAAESDGPQRTWSPLVQEWEALKSAQRIESDEPERIPEGDLRSIVARHFAIEPEDLTDWHIELAAVDLCRHYERVQVIPSAISSVNSTATERQNPTPIPDADFWKEREEEFRRQDVQANKGLGATWFSQGEYWTFHAASASSASATSIECFKSLAREAAEGLRSQRGAEAWIDWLDWMRQAKDEDSGKCLYVKNRPGSVVISEREREHMMAAGEAIPAGELIEFIGTEEGGIERRMYWVTPAAIIENLFENSVNQCLRLRSLAPHDVPRVLELRSLTPDPEEEAIRRGQNQVQAGDLAQLAAKPLQGIAEGAMVPKASGNGATRRGYRSEIRAYMKSNTLRTNQIAARHFGVSVHTLKSMMSSKGKPRFSEDTLKKVLNKIGHKEP
jgi:hypothetical protein